MFNCLCYDFIILFFFLNAFLVLNMTTCCNDVFSTLIYFVWQLLCSLIKNICSLFWFNVIQILSSKSYVVNFHSLSIFSMLCIISYIFPVLFHLFPSKIFCSFKSPWDLTFLCTETASVLSSALSCTVLLHTLHIFYYVIFYVYFRSISIYSHIVRERNRKKWGH